MTLSDHSRTLLISTALSLLFVGVLFSIDPAGAEAPTATPPPTEALQLRCRLFTSLLSSESVLDTQDATTEIGQWIAEQDGWRLHAIDFEVGQKSTGFPQGYRHVCLSPAT